MTPSTQQIAFEHALREAPRESCGLVVFADTQEFYVPCRNIAEAEEDFIIDPEDYARAEDMGEVLAVVHSHPNASPRPSQADLVACEASGLPWHIVSTPHGVWHYFEPKGYEAPYVGRQFVHGVLDCYALVRDWFKRERGVQLRDYDRRMDWWNKGQNLYIDHFREEGFEEVIDGTLIPGDLILMQIRSPVPNHAAIYLGNDIILHHLQNHLSKREVYGGWWRKNTRMVIRHKGAE